MYTLAAMTSGIRRNWISAITAASTPADVAPDVTNTSAQVDNRNTITQVDLIDTQVPIFIYSVFNSINFTYTSFPGHGNRL